jgi:hypothetical protein
MFAGSTGLVFSFGYNVGALGLGDMQDRYTPTLVRLGLSSVSAVSVAGMYCSFVVGMSKWEDIPLALSLLLIWILRLTGSNGLIFGFGGNSYGALGVGDAFSRITPTLLSGLTNIVAISERFNTLVVGEIWRREGMASCRFHQDARVDSDDIDDPQFIVFQWLGCDCPLSRPLCALNSVGGC